MLHGRMNDTPDYLTPSWMDRCRIVFRIGNSSKPRILNPIEARLLYYGARKVMGQLALRSRYKLVAPTLRIMAWKAVGKRGFNWLSSLIGLSSGKDDQVQSVEIIHDNRQHGSYIVPCVDGDMSTVIKFIYPYRTIVADNQYLYKGEQCVLDVGANIGTFSLFAAKNGAVKVFAFEPVPNTFATLNRMIRANRAEGVIKAYNLAVGECEGVGEISYCGHDDGEASFVFDRRGTRHVSAIVSLDEFCSRNNIEPDFIKIDVEGYERQVIKGAAGLLKARKPILSFGAYHNPTDSVDLVKLVKQLNPEYACEIHDRGEIDCYCQ